MPKATSSFELTLKKLAPIITRWIHKIFSQAVLTLVHLKIPGRGMQDNGNAVTQMQPYLIVLLRRAFL
jgi:hypothetical protein